MAHPTDLWTNQPFAIAYFIHEFNDRLKEKNIIEDNVYNMVKTTFESWQTMLPKNVNKIVNIEKFKEVQIIAVFCANATNSNKLPPFFIFKNGNEEIKEYAKDQSEFISKTEQDMLTKESEIFAYWYRNYFMEHVRRYQKMKAKNVNNKVILLLKDREEFKSLLKVKESDFETMSFPTSYLTDLQPLHRNLIINFKRKIQRHTFPNSTNIKDCLNFISNLWTTSFQDKVYFHLWNKLFQRNVIEENTAFKEIPKDPQNSGPKKLQKEEATIGEIVEPVLSMEENNPSTSFGTPKLELNKNVIEENTVFKEVPEDPQNSDPEKLQQEEAAIKKTLETPTKKHRREENIIEESTVFKATLEDSQTSRAEIFPQEETDLKDI